MSLLVKICGMTTNEDAAMCEEQGADFLGFIFHPSSPRNVDTDFTCCVKTGGAKKVGVFVKQSAAEVIETLENGELDFAQLHGGQNEEFCKAVGKDLVIKVLWPQKYDSAKEFQVDIDRFSAHCSYMLFDAGKSGGGHGQAMDFGIFKDVTIPVPWLLAGGLSAENLKEALAEVKPNGVDLNSGVESEPGKKDKMKLSKAFEAMGL